MCRTVNGLLEMDMMGFGRPELQRWSPFLLVIDHRYPLQKGKGFEPLKVQHDENKNWPLQLLGDAGRIFQIRISLRFQRANGNLSIGHFPTLSDSQGGCCLRLSVFGERSDQLSHFTNIGMN